MGWNLFDARECFRSSRNNWDTINGENGNHVLLDSLFWEPLIQYFGSEHVYLAINDSSLGKGVALIEAGGRGFWRTFQPSQAPLGPIIFDRLGALHWRKHISALLSDLPCYALGFSATQQDPDFTHFGNLANGHVERLDYITTSRLTLKGTFEEYWMTRSHNLVHNLARQRRRFTGKGTSFELITQRGAERVAEEVELYGQIEGAGWKGKVGTAIIVDNVQGLFYREMLESFCRRNEGVIYRLNVNGAPIASALCLERNGTLIVLKITYDEKMPQCSPGLLLHEEMLKSLFNEKRVSVVEYYGRYSDWHRKWTDETRVMYHVNVYRSGWLRSARRLLKLAAGRFAPDSPAP